MHILIYFEHKTVYNVAKAKQMGYGEKSLLWKIFFIYTGQIISLEQLVWVALEHFS